jgi:hypothetical protein
MPKKRATPVIKRFLIEFMLVNCKNDSPTEAEKQKILLVIKMRGIKVKMRNFD